MRVTTGRGAGLSAGGIAVPEQGAEASPPDQRRRLGPRAAALITLLRPLPSLDELAGGLTREVAAQIDRILLWTPVAFGAGASAYLAARSEPSVWLAAAITAAGLVVALLARLVTAHRAVRALTALAAVACAGFLVGKLHSDAVSAPIAPPSLGVATLEAFVVDVEAPSEKGPRLLLAPVSISGLSPAQTPTRVRLVVPSTAPPEETPPPGSAVRVAALLNPPPGPAAPGAYDFARDAWFEGLGGVGLAMRPPERADLAAPPWRLRLEMAVNALRWSVAKRLAAGIRQVMGPDDGGAAGLAVAVTTSHQDWLGADRRDDLRYSGLAHMLAIAGLHTAAVSGFAFFAFRLIIAAWPWLALRVSGKKVAAAAALLVVAAYLVLSGAHPPARRAAITAGVAFAAILADRRAVSLHSLAIAALVILVVEPDVVLAPGFEMSFCATASLVALAEIWRRAPAPTNLVWPLRWLQKGRDWLIAMAAVSFVAGAATGPFTIQHFNRVANYGVFANLSADFVAAAILMPSLAICLLAQALNLGHDLAWPVYLVAGWAARAVIWLGHIFATAPGASLTLSSAPTLALAISYLGIVFACLWRGRLRWLGAAMAFAVALWPRPIPPVAWIAADGDDAAIVIEGREVALKPGARAYATGLWAQRRGFSLPADPDEAAALQQAYFECDRKGCAPLAPAHPALAAWWGKRPPKDERAAELCRGAEILIWRAEGPVPSACASAHILTRADFAERGAAEIFASPAGWRFSWSQPLRGARPWTLYPGS